MKYWFFTFEYSLMLRLWFSWSIPLLTLKIFSPHSFDYLNDHYFFTLPFAVGVDTPTTKFHRHNDRSEASLGQLNICIRQFEHRLLGPHALIKPRPLLVLFSQHHDRPAVSQRLDCNGSGTGVLVVRWNLSVFLTLINIWAARFSAYRPDNRGVLARKIIWYREVGIGVRLFTADCCCREIAAPKNLIQPVKVKIISYLRF